MLLPPTHPARFYDRQVSVIPDQLEWSRCVCILPLSEFPMSSPFPAACWSATTGGPTHGYCRRPRVSILFVCHAPLCTSINILSYPLFSLFVYFYNSTPLDSAGRPHMTWTCLQRRQPTTAAMPPASTTAYAHIAPPYSAHHSHSAARPHDLDARAPTASTKHS